jgi:hypothetical protein
MVTNEYQYVTKMALSVNMGGLWGDFIAMFWITNYLQRPIYIWNKYQNTLCLNVTWIFNLSPLIYSMYNFQHFEPIQYVNGLFRSLPTFQVNDFKVNIDLDDFPSLSESMMQQPSIQLSQLTTHFYWNENFDFALMDILKNN